MTKAEQMTPIQRLEAWLGARETGENRMALFMLLTGQSDPFDVCLIVSGEIAAVRPGPTIDAALTAALDAAGAKGKTCKTAIDKTLRISYSGYVSKS